MNCQMQSMLSERTQSRVCLGYGSYLFQLKVSLIESSTCCSTDSFMCLSTEDRWRRFERHLKLSIWRSVSFHRAYRSQRKLPIRNVYLVLQIIYVRTAILSPLQT